MKTIVSLAENIKPLAFFLKKTPRHCSKRVGEVFVPMSSIRLVAVLGLGRRDEIKHELKLLHSAPLLADIQSHLSRLF